MATITKPPILDETGVAIKNSIDLLTANINRTADNIAYDNNLTIKGKIQAIDLTSGGSITGSLVISKDNTETSIVSSELVLGNNIPVGTTGCTRGVLRLFGTGSQRVNIYPTSITAERDIIVPDKSGTIGLQDSITVLAQSTGSKTYAQHILALKSAWDSLTTEQRLKCKLVRGTQIYQCTETGSAGRFTCTLIDNQKVYIEMIRISNQTFGYLSGTTYTDLSNNTADTTLKLYLPL